MGPLPVGGGVYSALFGFVDVLVLKQTKISQLDPVPAIVSLVALFIGFGMLSLAFGLTSVTDPTLPAIKPAPNISLSRIRRK
jgi:xanthine/uracil permease